MGSVNVSFKGKELEVVFTRENPEFDEIDGQQIITPPRNHVKEIYDGNRLVTNSFTQKELTEITEKIN